MPQRVFIGIHDYELVFFVAGGALQLAQLTFSNNLPPAPLSPDVVAYLEAAKTHRVALLVPFVSKEGLVFVNENEELKEDQVQKVSWGDLDIQAKQRPSEAQLREVPILFHLWNSTNFPPKVREVGERTELYSHAYRLTFVVEFGHQRLTKIELVAPLG